MMRRSRHIAVCVPEKDFEKAQTFYMEAFGLRMNASKPNQAELTGDNFTLWLEATDDDAGLVLQEFVPDNPTSIKERLTRWGCRIVQKDGKEDSGYGFHVGDPFGMKYHVYTAGDAEKKD